MSGLRLYCDVGGSGCSVDSHPSSSRIVGRMPELLFFMLIPSMASI